MKDLKSYYYPGAEEATQMREWLLNVGAPIWASVGRTKIGWFAERISSQGEADASYFRTFVQARHVYSFSAIGRMGWEGPWADLVEQTIDSLLSNARRADGLYVHRLTEDGRVLDPRADLYDQAFILLALGASGAVLDRPDLFDAAEALLEKLEYLWAHTNGGFNEGEIASPELRRQNPHMHLLEAFLLLAKSSRRQRFWDSALNIARLAANNFIDAETGALREYFRDDWLPLGDGPRRLGDVVEPGHCCEWAWLFEQLVTEGWTEGIALSNALTTFARRYGLSHSGTILVDEVWIDGTIKSERARLWPQTERAKAAISRWLRLGTSMEAGEITAAIAGLRRYLEGVFPGLWRDKLYADGAWVNEPAPGSSLYHISCAVAELTEAQTVIDSRRNAR